MTGSGEATSLAPRTPTRVGRRGLPDTVLGVKQLVLIVALFASYLYVGLGRPLIPDRFSRDSVAIERLVNETSLSVYGLSFTRIGDLYRTLGLTTPVSAGLASFALFSTLLMLVVWPRLRQATVLDVGVAAVMLVLGAVFLGQFSKDIFVMIVTGAALLPARLRSRQLWIAAAFVLYAGWFRTYWWIVLAFYLVLLMYLRRGSSYRRIIAFAVVGLAALAVAFMVFRGVDLVNYRYSVNEWRSAEDARTMIAMDLPGGLVGGWFSANVVLATLLVPVPLLLLGDPYFLLITAFIVAMWFLFFRAVGRLRGRLDAQALSWIALVVAFVTLQSVFEPDYGSYLRHLSPIYPLIIGVILKARTSYGDQLTGEVALERVSLR